MEKTPGYGDPNAPPPVYPGNPAQPAYPPQQGGYPPQQGGYPAQPGYPPQPPPGQPGYGPAYGQPPYGQPTTTTQVMQPGQTVIIQQGPPDHMVISILSCLCCCWCTGIVAIYYSMKVQEFTSQGNIPAAQEASSNAKKWAIISCVVGVVIAVIIIIIYFAAFATAAASISSY